MRKFLTSLAAISLIGSLFIFTPSRALAAAAGTAKVTSTDVDIIQVDVSRENDGNLQTYLAAPGAFINLQIRLDEAGDDADLVDTVAFSLKNAIFTGAYTNDNAYTCTDTGVDDNLDAGNLVWTTGNKAATPVATISASINCGAGTGADGGVDSMSILYFQVQVPAHGSAVLTVDSGAADKKVYFFAQENNDEIYVGSGSLPASSGAGNCTHPDFSTAGAAQGSIQEALFAAFAGVNQNSDTIIVCDGTYTYTGDFEEYEGADLFDGSILVVAESDGGANLNGANDFQLIHTDDVDLEIDGIDFIDGYTSGAGAAIAVYDGDLDISDSSFDSNTADDDSDSNDGGAVFVSDGDLHVDNSVFTDNYAYSDGGAVWAKFGDVTIGDSEFSGNYSGDDGGAVVVRSGTDFSSRTQLTITESLFDGNEADNYGGAVFSGHSVDLDVAESEFTDNYTDDDEGAAIYAQDDATIGFSIFEDNEADSDDAGAIWFDEQAHIHDSDFVGNSSYGRGGAVYAEVQLRLEDSTFTSNESGDEGGAVFARGVSTVSGSRFVRNTSVAWGGGLSAYDDSTISDTVFRSNHSRKGGAIDSMGERLYLSSTKFINNYASLWGGAISRQANEYKKMDLGDVDATTIFRANRARVGGPVALYNWGSNRLIARQFARFWLAVGAHAYIVR